MDLIKVEKNKPKHNRFKSIKIHDNEFYSEDIEKMSKQEIKEICSFIESEKDLLFIQTYCNENFKHIIDNILFNNF